MENNIERYNKTNDQESHPCTLVVFRKANYNAIDTMYVYSSKKLFFRRSSIFPIKVAVPRDLLAFFKFN